MLIILFFLLPSFETNGNTEIDSLENLLSKVSGEQRLLILYKLSFKYRLNIHKNQLIKETRHCNWQKPIMIKKELKMF